MLEKGTCAAAIIVIIIVIAGVGAGAYLLLGGVGVSLAAPEDANALDVTITSPESGTSTSDASIVVTGIVSKDPWDEYTDLTLTLYVWSGPVEVPINSDGSFSYTVELVVGWNNIAALVRYPASNYARVFVIQVIRWTQSPEGEVPWVMIAAVIVVIAIGMAVVRLKVKKG